MTATVGVPRETFPGERRVALTPKACETLIKAKLELIVESGAGLSAGFSDEEYAKRGVRIGSRAEVFAGAGIIVQVRTPGANPAGGANDLGLLRSGQLLIGLGEPLTALKEDAELAARGVDYLSLELVPRITRAQAMDVLS